MLKASDFFKEENDFLYRRGYAKGLEEAQQIIKSNITIAMAAKMKKEGLSPIQIEEFTQLSIEIIEKL